MQQVWVLRYKKGNNHVETLLFSAESLGQAEAAGRLWCRREGDGLQPCRYISALPWLAFDAEELLNTEVKREAPAPVVQAPAVQTPVVPAGVRKYFQSVKDAVTT